jgi:hypothetical protein
MEMNLFSGGIKVDIPLAIARLGLCMGLCLGHQGIVDAFPVRHSIPTMLDLLDRVGLVENRRTAETLFENARKRLRLDVYS